MKEFPQTKLLIIAAIDAVQFAGLVISATGVPPVVTVLLMHASTVFLVMASRHAFPERKYSSVQMRGVQLIALAVTISLVGSFLDTTNPSSQMLSDPYSSVLYLAMCALQGFSTLCKVTDNRSTIIVHNSLNVQTLILINYEYWCSTGENDRGVVEACGYPLLELPTLRLPSRHSMFPRTLHLSPAR
jgi:CRT-like, chloroquine-resistance transporter-like